MFEKLRRAKSFIHRSKHEEDIQKHADLDLSETSHLRRNVVIDSEVLKQQKKLTKIKESVSDQKKTTLKRQVSRSSEHLHDQVLEQLRRINFGDSYSKKDAQKLRDTSEESGGFVRRHTSYRSERNIRRRSFNAEERAKNLQKSAQNERFVVHRNSGDVLSSGAFNPVGLVRLEERTINETTEVKEKSVHDNSKVDVPTNLTKVEVEQSTGRNQQRVQHRSRSESVSINSFRNNPAVRSENGFGMKIRAKSSQRSQTNENQELPKANEDFVNSFDRRNPAYWSERTAQLVRQQCSQQIVTSSQIGGSDDNFLLNRKSIDLSYNFDRRNPAYVSDRSARTTKPDVLERSGLKSLFQKVKGSSKRHGKKDYSDTSSFSGGSTSSSAASGSIDRNHSIHYSEKSLAQSSKTVHEEQSRKRQHSVMKANFDRIKPAVSSERTFFEESRKKAFDRLKRDGNKSDIKDSSGMTGT